MAAPAEIADLLTAARCFRCVSPGAVTGVQIYEALTWANGGIPPAEQFVFGDPDAPFAFGDPGTGDMFGQ